LKGHPTGLWLEELAAPYYIFKEAGFDVILASIAGGPVPIDAGSMSGDFFTKPARRFMHDGAAFSELCHSKRLADIPVSELDAIFFTGGHGVVVDYVGNSVVKSAIETMYGAGKVVATVCHGPVCLEQCVKSDGTPLVRGLNVTGFSCSEEAALNYTVPWVIENKFKELGGNYSKGGDWTSHIEIAGNLLTGQNPQSSEELAHAVVETLPELRRARRGAPFFFCCAA